MTESDFRINISKNINEVLKKLYNNISDNNFDPFIDLSKIPSVTLKDFWLYTAGFIGLKNQEEFDKMLSDQEVLSVLNGKFHLRTLPLDQAQEFAKKANKKVPDKGSGIKIDLYSVQDGTYSIMKGFKDEQGNTINYLGLSTRPLEYHTDKKIQDVNITPRGALKTLRNVFAHRTPTIDGNNLIFERGDDEIVVSKMWLRGYTELFSRKSKTLNSEEIEKLLLLKLEKENSLSSKQEIDSLLSNVKEMFGEDVTKNFYKLSTFIHNRLKSQKNFNTLNKEDKIKILSSILANNVEYIQEGSGSINASIIYSLQQLVGLELYARGEYSDLDLEEYDIEKMQEIIKQVESFNTRCNMTQTLLKTGRSFSPMANKKFFKELNSVKSKVSSYLKGLYSKQKLETSNMELYNLDDLNHLPVEVAANTVLLMCFNSLITSSFYDDILAKTDTKFLNQEQEAFFNKFDFSNIEFYYNDVLRQDFNAGQKAYLLLCLREALCHGTISYQLPQVKNNPSFSDCVICFKTDKRQNAEIYGTIKDFYQLFSSNIFSAQRNPNIITGQLKEFNQEEINRNEEEEQAYKNMNEIIQNLVELDEYYKNL